MIWSLDSSVDRPTPAQAQAARTAGIGMWWGYLATKPDVGLLAPWTQADFAVVLEAGLDVGAFVSGWDDPVALRQLAAAWGIPFLALDDEDGIRPLTSPDWRPAFLQASGAGLYGLLERHTIAAPFRIVAAYPAGGCTGATWSTSPAPPEPHGWQCQGTHTEFGLSVDRSALDDWFGGQTMNAQQAQQLQDLWTQLTQAADNATDPAGNPINLGWQVSYILSAVRALASAQLTPDLDQRLTALEAAVARIEKGLQAA